MFTSYIMDYQHLTTTMFSDHQQDLLATAAQFPQQQNQLFSGMDTTALTPATGKKNSSTTVADDLNPKDGNNKGNINGRMPRKRSGKKDRHSKIVTAQGTRDRRMRLSLDIARRFFNLQDMLGFDKASKTVDWLLTKSKSAIKELSKSFPAFSHHKEQQDEGKSLEDLKVMNKKTKKKKNSLVANNKYLPQITTTTTTQPLQLDREESRTMARARARERTLEKMRSRKLPKSNQLISTMTNHIKSPSLDTQAVQHNPISNCVAPIKHHTRKSSLFPSNFSYQKYDQGNNNIPNFQENWGIDNFSNIQSGYGGFASLHHHLYTAGNFNEHKPTSSSTFTAISDLHLESHFVNNPLYGISTEPYINQIRCEEE